MLKPPHVRARQRFMRRYLGPVLAALIISAGAIYFFGIPKRAAAASNLTAPAVALHPFPNCAAARAAGAAPVRQGEPGYGPHLDADSDGIGCEPKRF